MDTQGTVGVVAFGFGEPADLASNQYIARRAVGLARTENVRFICTDRDVAPHLVTDKNRVREIDPALYPHTFRVAVRAVSVAHEYGIDILHVVAAPCHIWRCQRDLGWAAKAEGVTLNLIPEPVSGYLYEPTAHTWYTRKVWIWWPLEITYRIWSSLFPGLYKHLRS